MCKFTNQSMPTSKRIGKTNVMWILRKKSNRNTRFKLERCRECHQRLTGSANKENGPERHRNGKGFEAKAKQKKKRETDSNSKAKEERNGGERSDDCVPKSIVRSRPSAPHADGFFFSFSSLITTRRARMYREQRPPDARLMRANSPGLPAVFFNWPVRPAHESDADPESKKKNKKQTKNKNRT